MGYYEVLLGIDQAGRDTLDRIRVTVPARSRFHAAMEAEVIADSGLDDPARYSRTIQVQPVNRQAMAMAA